jgi:hypothetical protein
MFCRPDRTSIKKWGKAMKLKFLGLLCCVVDHVIRPGFGSSADRTSGKEALCEIWNTRMQSKEILSLGLGIIDDVPTLHTRDEHKVSKLEKYSKRIDVLTIFAD